MQPDLVQAHVGTEEAVAENHPARLAAGRREQIADAGVGRLHDDVHRPPPASPLDDDAHRSGCDGGKASGRLAIWRGLFAPIVQLCSR